MTQENSPTRQDVYTRITPADCRAGINVLSPWATGFSVPTWMTFKQALNLSKPA